MSAALDPRLIGRIAADAAALQQSLRARTGPGFDGLVTADPVRAHAALARLRARGDSFLELGSGTGIITILADLLGFDACGIEVRPDLVDAAEDLAERHGAQPRFVLGSYLPDEPEFGELVDADFNVTREGGANAWDEVRLRDFDVVYVFPWPSEEELFHELMRRHGTAGQTLVTFRAHEGFVAHPGGEVIA